MNKVDKLFDEMAELFVKLEEYTEQIGQLQQQLAEARKALQALLNDPVYIDARGIVVAALEASRAKE